jgi:hypothetical protein
LLQLAIAAETLDVISIYMHTAHIWKKENVMHALPLLATLVDPYEILFGQIAPGSHPATRLGDEPNPEARLFRAARRGSHEPTRPR